MDDGLMVTFVEATGAGAEDELRAAARAMAEPAGAAELLRSAERDDLWLLVLRGSTQGFRPPSGARTWRFVATPARPSEAGR